MVVILQTGMSCTKMVDKKVIGTAALALLIGFMASLGVNVVVDDQGYLPYTCDKESVPDMLCYKLSRVNDDGVQRNCYYDRDASRKYKVCSDGWERLLSAEDFGILEQTCPKALVIAYTDDDKYFCDDIGVDATCIKDNTVAMPFRP